ncbi:MAG: hypothetical protein GY744_05640 [Gammaproteobacteria bacterium]|nr:hypothetical protein [Gammaproteobacteria bacterium]
MTKKLLATSLFNGEKPVAIIYTDHSKSTIPITEKDFTQYKQLISLSSKALAFLAKK